VTNSAFTRLRDFITTAMQMSHVYQPVMLRTLIDKGGKASISEVAQALLAEDRAQLDYYREITKRMPGAVLRRRGVIDYLDVYGPRPIATGLAKAGRKVTTADVLSGFLMRRERSSSSPRATMDFRTLPPQRRQGIGRSHAGPDTRFGKRRSDRFANRCNC
jgi:hypothetical protein